MGFVDYFFIESEEQDVSTQFMQTLKIDLSIYRKTLNGTVMLQCATNLSVQQRKL